MASRIAVIGIIVEEPDSVKELNQILHEYGEYIIGRMGIPCRQRPNIGVRPHEIPIKKIKQS